MSQERYPESSKGEPQKKIEVLISEDRFLRQVFEFASRAHKGQKRVSGEDYIDHPREVVRILYEEWDIEDRALLASGFLHDTAEDTDTTLEEIRIKFGGEVFSLVDGASKFRSEGGKDDDKETLRKVVGRSYIDPRVAILKLADRLHNMRTLNALPAEKQISKSKETLDVYAKLAQSLGIWLVKVSLEDLSFKYKDPKVFQEVNGLIDNDPRRGQLFLTNMTTRLEGLLTAGGLSGSVEVKPNGYWATYEKRRRMALHGKSLPDSFERIADLTSFRVTFDSEQDCYSFLGIVHREFHSVLDQKRFDEFLANPRDNGYSALHVVLDLPQGAAEIAITTRSKEAFNNWGVVDLLKGGKKEIAEYVLKLVFEPSGVWFMKKEATGIDLAILINPEKGVHAEEIAVDGRRYPLSVVFPNGCDAEIIWGDEQESVNADYLSYALPPARKVLEEVLIRERSQRLSTQGKKIMERILSERGLLDLADIPGLPEKILHGRADMSLDNLYFLLGGGYVDKETIKSELDRSGITKENLGLTTIKVSGLDKPRILADISTWIAEVGGNILAINLPSIIDGKFVLRIVVKSLDLESEEKIRGKLERDERFAEQAIV